MNIQPFFDAVTSTFSYLVDDGCGRAAVIDPVMGFQANAGRLDPEPAEILAKAIWQQGLTLEWLLETHAHADHLSGAHYLRERFGGRLAIGAKITRVQQVFQGIFNTGDLPTDGSQFDQLLHDGDRFNIGCLIVEVLHVPGHTPADVAYRVCAPDGSPDAVFVGDTLFMPERGTARCDFPGGCAPTLFRSVRRLLDLPEATKLLVCHDYPEAGQEARCQATVAEHRHGNIHVRDGVTEDAFVAQRNARDASLSLPALMLPAVQVNIRAGAMPRAEGNGVAYLKIPVNCF
jgi:glyoxylase-like metal-dependent hydrolase (beta-lactamase superfamily II)